MTTGLHPPERALAGVRVIDIGQIYNGGYCGLLFAQMGAEVIKVEPPQGENLRFRSRRDAESHEFLMLNSNKRSVVADLKTERGRDVLHRLLANADVAIENYAPGVMERLGLAPADLCARHPRLVYASGKAFGSDGPYANRPGMDLTVQAMCGSVASTGFPDGPPVKAGPAFIDFLGATHLYAAAVTALHQRERTGRGQYLEVSMHDAAYPTLASAFGALYDTSGRVVPERTGNAHSGLAVSPYNVYRARDGYVAMVVGSQRHFVRLATAMGQPGLVDDPRFADGHARARNTVALDAVVEQWTSRHARDEAVELLLAEDVPCAPVLSVAEVAEDPHLVQRGMIHKLTHPVLGEVAVPGCSLRLSESSPVEPVLAEALGTSTSDVLRRICGYSAAETREMARQLDEAMPEATGRRVVARS